jgi:putative DNA primase/helicase
VPGAVHEDITTALKAIPDDARDYAQLRYGQAITGHKPPDDAIDVQHGSGENGKTTVLTAIRRALGDYAAVLPQRVLLASPEAHTTELMTLRGVRIGIIEELPEEHQLSVARIKIATAPVITARLMYKDNVTFANACALVISTNYRPQIRETDHGTWRRLEGSIPFPYTFRKPHEHLRDDNDRRGDGTLRQRIETDDGPRAQAMLAWLAAGAQSWYAGEPREMAAGGVLAQGREPRTMGQPPECVRRDVAAWRESCDLLYGYMTDRLEFGSDAHVISEDLLSDLNTWLRGRGHRDWSMELMTARLTVHSEAREHRVAKIRLRADQVTGLSRPPGYALTTAKERYTAWTGLRFKIFQDDETAGRPGWSDPKQTISTRGSYKEFTSTPDHPGQEDSRQASFTHVWSHDFARLWEMADHGAAGYDG